MKGSARTASARSALGLVLLALLPVALRAQNRDVEVTREQKPVYPDSLEKTQTQGNVILIGRIDAHGKLRDLLPLATSHELFTEPAMTAVQNWQFRPAIKGGRPVEVAANFVFHFRIQNEKRGQIPRPILGDLKVFPADAAGKPRGPDGFPVHRGTDLVVRVEAVIDVSPVDKARSVSVRAEAVSRKGRSLPVFEGSVPVRPKADEAKVSFSAKVGPDWEDGVWMLRFSVDGANAGGGQFWLAGDPARFDFAAAMPKK